MILFNESLSYVVGDVRVPKFNEYTVVKEVKLYICPICGSKDIYESLYGDGCYWCQNHGEYPRQVIPLATPQEVR